MYDFFKKFFQIFEENGFNIIHVVAPHDQVGRRNDVTFEGLRFAKATFHIPNIKYKYVNDDNSFTVTLCKEKNGSVTLSIFTEARGINPEWLEISGSSFDQLLEKTKDNLLKQLPFKREKIFPKKELPKKEGQTVQISIQKNPKKGVVRGFWVADNFSQPKKIYKSIAELYETEGHFTPCKVLLLNDDNKIGKIYGYHLEYAEIIK